MTGTELLSALAESTPPRAAVQELAAVRDAVETARWRIALQPGSPGRTAAPPADRVLLAGDTCA